MITKEQVQSLKTFLEKELQQKRFLEESLNLVNAVSALSNQVAELNAQLDSLTAKKEKAADDYQVALNLVTEEKTILKQIKADCQKIIDETNDRKKAIILEGQLEKEKLVVEGDKALDEVNKEVLAKKMKKAKLEKDIEELEVRKTSIEKEINDTLARLGKHVV